MIETAGLGCLEQVHARPFFCIKPNSKFYDRAAVVHRINSKRGLQAGSAALETAGLPRSRGRHHQNDSAWGHDFKLTGEPREARLGQGRCGSFETYGSNL